MSPECGITDTRSPHPMREQSCGWTAHGREAPPAAAANICYGSEQQAPLVHLSCWLQSQDPGKNKREREWERERLGMIQRERERERVREGGRERTGPNQVFLGINAAGCGRASWLCTCLPVTTLTHSSHHFLLLKIKQQKLEESTVKAG